MRRMALTHHTAITPSPGPIECRRPRRDLKLITVALLETDMRAACRDVCCADGGGGFVRSLCNCIMIRPSFGLRDRTKVRYKQNTK